MPGHRELHRSDRNAALLYDLARQLGMSVDVCQRPCDALGGYLGLGFAIEVKDGAGKLRPRQVAFQATYRGPLYIWRSADDVIATHRELHALAQRLIGLRLPRGRA